MADIQTIKENKRAIKIIQNIIKSYDGIFDPTKEMDSYCLANDIIKSLKRNRLIKTNKP